MQLQVTKSALTGAPRGAPSAAKDAEFREAIVGKWRVIRLFRGFLLDHVATIFPNGRVNWKGNATLHFVSYPYALSGTWRVKNGRFDYKVETSNIPDFFPRRSYRIYRDSRCHCRRIWYFDPGDEVTYVDLRVK